MPRDRNLIEQVAGELRSTKNVLRTWRLYARTITVLGDGAGDGSPFFFTGRAQVSTDTLVSAP